MSNVISASNRYPEWVRGGKRDKDGDIEYCQRQSYSKSVECDLCGKRRKGDFIVDDNGRVVRYLKYSITKIENQAPILLINLC